MYKLAFFVPAEHKEAVKTAIFAAGAGRIGNYDSCCWEVQGTGQFRALQGSNPFVGQQGKIEMVGEYRVELVCEDHLIKAAVAALRSAHPYEEPAFDAWKLETF
ncbi:MAG TPA: YqfO family protein [Dongiaceae bacterium]|nr:YqfO family protein [Dongiaceae bacterium]